MALAATSNASPPPPDSPAAAPVLPYTYIPLVRAYTLDLTRDRLAGPDNSVRMYSSAPDQVTLQIRTYGQVASRGVYRKIVSAALLGLEEARQLHTLLGQWLSAQEPQP